MTYETILKALDKIEPKLQQLPELVLQQRELGDRLLTLEQKGTHMSGDTAGAAVKSLGSQAWESLQANMDLLKKTSSVRLELKAAGDPITTTSGRSVIAAGVGAPGAAVLGLQNAIPSRVVGSTSAAEYSRYTGKQGGAAQQAAEGDAKSAVRPDHTIITQVALTVAGYTKMSRQAMSDRAELVKAVDITLQRSVGTALDVILTTGGTNFSGGIAGLATAYTSLVYTALVDATSEGVAAMQLAGFQPDAVALNPADWLAITVAKGTDGHYLSGAYLGMLPENMRGLRVVLSPTVAAGKSLLIDSAHAELLIAEGFAIEAAYDGDDFTKNLVTVLGEMRVIPVFRTVGAARLITPKA